MSTHYSGPATLIGLPVVIAAAILVVEPRAT